MAALRRAVLPDNFPLGQPLDAGQFDVLAVQNVEHRGPHQTHQGRHLEPTQSDGRKDIVIDASHALDGEPSQLDSEDPHEDEPKPEAGHRLSKQCDHLSEEVERCIFPDRRKHSYRNSNHSSEYQRDAGKLHCIPYSLLQ